MTTTATRAPRTYQRQAALVEQLPGSDPARFRFLASTTALQADGMAIPSQAWDLSRYRRHGPVLLNHRLDSLPIGRAERVWTDPRGLWADIVLDEHDPTAAQVAGKIRRGYITGVSVNFRVHKRQGSTVERCELVEISVVSVPEDAGVELAAMRSLRRSRRDELASIKSELVRLQSTATTSRILTKLAEAQLRGEI